jgi:hypothetical protein
VIRWMKITSTFSLCLLTWKGKPMLFANDPIRSSFVQGGALQDGPMATELGIGARQVV